VADISGDTYKNGQLASNWAIRGWMLLTWTAFDIVEGKFSHSGVEFHQKRQWLANPSCAP